jgi:pimeloyl-ACP methyl ester carboxylesterase
VKRLLGFFHKYLFWIGFSLTLVGGLTYFVLSTPLAILLAVIAHDPSRPGLVMILIGLALSALGFSEQVRRWGHERNVSWKVVFLVASLAIASLYCINTLGTRPYRQEEVHFRNRFVELVGTLLIPRGDGPHPAVIFMHGSGPEFRWTQYPLAAHLARHGIAALIYDKRGVGASKGGHPGDPYQDLAQDALAGMHYLKGRAEIHPQQIGLWGHSEGGSTAPLVASLSPDVTFLVVTSAAGVTYEELVFYEVVRREKGLSAEETAKAVALRHQINEYYRTGKGYEEVVEAVRRAQDEPWYKAAGILPRGVNDVSLYGSHDANAYLEGLRADPNWEFDPMTVFEELDIPMLFIYGGRDWEHPIEESMKRFQERLVDSSDKDVEIIVFPEADHTIFGWTGPLPRYTPGFLDAVTRWLLEHVQTANSYQLPGRHTQLSLRCPGTSARICAMEVKNYAFESEADKLATHCSCCACGQSSYVRVPGSTLRQPFH